MRSLGRLLVLIHHLLVPRPILYHTTEAAGRECFDEAGAARYLDCVRARCDEDLLAGIAWEDSEWCPILGTPLPH